MSYYLGYSALTDFFPTMCLRPNPACDDNFCQQRQADVKARPPKEQESVKGSSLDEKEVIHEDNEWGMWSYNYYVYKTTMHYSSSAVHFQSPAFEVDRCNILKKAATQKI